ncbi:MAG: hypothetical protein V3573_04415 [Desulfovibrionaceae bacterium]
MQINGAHLNHFIYQNRGDGVRPSEIAQSLNAQPRLGNTPRMADAESGQSLSRTFAQEIARRAKAHTGQDGQPKDTSALAAGLADAVDYLRTTYGDDVATAAEAMVLGGTSSGITEQNLGDSLTNVLRMVDRNFGFAAGDATIAKFNGSLNDSINEFFDNGQSERFLAAPVGTSTALADSKARALAGAELDRNAAGSALEQMLAGFKEDLDKILEEDLNELTPQAQAEQQTEALQAAPSQTRALNAYASASGPAFGNAPQLLSVSV